MNRTGGATTDRKLADQGRLDRKLDLIPDHLASVASSAAPTAKPLVLVRVLIGQEH